MTGRRKRHSPEQIIRKLRDADAMLAAGKTIGEVCQALEISTLTLYRWRYQYSGTKADAANRLKELEEEAQRLKKRLAAVKLYKALLRRILARI